MKNKLPSLLSLIEKLNSLKGHLVIVGDPDGNARTFERVFSDGNELLGMNGGTTETVFEPWVYDLTDRRLLYGVLPSVSRIGS